MSFGYFGTYYFYKKITLISKPIISLDYIYVQLLFVYYFFVGYF